ncbi:MAG TPA: bL17 family ribosomal protein, partial [bacterium]|nr:bL17 family ribosomal protein [bacterium]
MRHRNKGVILGRTKEPREMMLRNLAASILIHEFAVTTKAKAKAVQPIVEHLLTIAKAGDLTARRRLLAILPQDEAVVKTEAPALVLEPAAQITPEAPSQNVSEPVVIQETPAPVLAV